MVLESYKADPKKVGFLDLPRELRDYVYTFAFRVHGAVFIYSPNPYAVRAIAKAKIVRHNGDGPAEPQPIGNIIPMSLMRTCHQLHAECSTILYEENIFSIWFLSDTELKLAFRELVRHVVFTVQVDHRVFKTELDEVSHGWARRFWPTSTQKGISMLETFPNLENLTFPMKPPRHRQWWRPAFFAVENKTREQRVAIATNWMKSRCPWQDQRLHECLHIQLVLPQSVSKADLEDSKFTAEEDKEWESTEFTDAFELMKSLK